MPARNTNKQSPSHSAGHLAKRPIHSIDSMLQPSTIQKPAKRPIHSIASIIQEDCQPPAKRSSHSIESIMEPGNQLAPPTKRIRHSIESIMQSDNQPPPNKRIRHSIESIMQSDNQPPPNKRIRHSIESIMQSDNQPPPNKRIRHSIESIMQPCTSGQGTSAPRTTPAGITPIRVPHSIAAILGDESIMSGDGSVNPAVFSDHVDDVWDDNAEMTVTGRSVKVRGVLKQVKVYGLRFSGSVREDLAELFNKFIVETLSAENADLDTTRFCMILKHKEMVKGDIFLNFRTFNQTDGTAIVNLIDKIEQSNDYIFADRGFDIEMYLYSPEGSTIAMEKFLEGRCSDKKLFDTGLGLNNVVKNTDNLCMARSFALAKARADIEYAKEHDPTAVKECNRLLKNLHDKHTAQLTAALDILLTSDVDVNKHSYGEADLIKIAEAHPDYNVHVFSKAKGQHRFTEKLNLNTDAPRQLHMACCNGHYNPFKPNKKTIKMWLCKSCPKGYKRRQQHVCKGACTKCKTKECQDDAPLHQKCIDCNVEFHTQLCYDRHKEARGQGQSPCSNFVVCTCKAYMPRSKFAKHDCNKKMYCNVCTRFDEDLLKHKCTWLATEETTKEKLKKKQEHFKIMAYDIEAVVCEDMSDIKAYCETQYANVIVTSRFCNECIDGPADAPCNNCGEKSKVFKYDSPTEDKNAVINKFLTYLLENDKCNDLTLFAHNGSGYDTHFILAELLNMGYTPKQPLVSGTRIIQMEFVPESGVNLNHLTFKDSYCLIPQPLASLPKAFSLPDIAKGEFPYLFNMPTNYHTVRMGLPSPSFYCAANKKPSAHKAFMEWWTEHKDDEFDFDKEIEEYCKMDVEILRRALIAYDKFTFELTGWRPLVHATTFASFSQFVLRHESLKNGEIAALSENGYNAGQNQSTIALQYIKWIEHKDKVQLAHKLSGGEKYVKIGCDTMALYALTCARTAKLRTRFPNVIEIWEHDIRAELKSDPVMRAFFAGLDVEVLRPRNSFQGGRTQTYQMIATPDTSKGETLEYLDFCSLYPYVTSRVAAYPIGVPEVIYHGFKPFVPGQPSPYQGVVKCRVLAPQALRYPVIGQSVRGRLIFGNCNQCVQDENTEPCNHTPAERSFVTTICTVELDLALENGYIVQEVMEVYHWDHWEVGGYFRNFTDKFLVAKQQASGWPEGVETDEQKAAFVADIWTYLGIVVNPDSVDFNESLRTIAKLFLNSSWGKLGQRGDRTETEFVNVESEEIGKLLRDADIEITGFSLVTEDIAMISHTPRAECIRTPRYSNVVYAAITTAVARCLLWKCLHRVQERALYCDTDSIIFVSRPGEDNLDDLRGSWLGKLTSELPPRFKMTKFVSIAAKVYACRLENDEGETQTILKVKGVTLDSEAAKLITMDKLEEMAREYVENGNIIEVTTTRGQIRRTMGAITTKTLSKRLKTVMNKLRVNPDFTTLPFGYVAPTTG